MSEWTGSKTEKPASPVSWWARHPWIVFWLSLALIPVLAVILGDHAALPALATLLVTLLSIVRGVRRAWAQSGLRATVLGVGAVTVIVLPVLLLPLYNGVQQRARSAKAQADVRVLVKGINIYAAHMGQPPDSLQALMKPAVNASGERVDALLKQLPRAPSGWSEYRYELADPKKLSDSRPTDSVSPALSKWRLVTTGDRMTLVGTEHGVETKW